MKKLLYVLVAFLPLTIPNAAWADDAEEMIIIAQEQAEYDQAEGEDEQEEGPSESSSQE